MAVKENLQVANTMHEKLQSVKTYASNYKRIEKLRSEIEGGNKQIKEDKNCITDNYDRQLIANARTSAVITFIISALLIVASAVALYFMFEGFFAEFDTALDKFQAKYGNKSASAFDQLQNLFSIFSLLSMVGIVISGAWIALLANGKDDEGLTTTAFVLAILMKIINLVIGVYAGIKLMTILHTEEFFMDNLWTFIKTAGIGLGMHVVLFLLFCFIKCETINKWIDKCTLDGAKKADERKYKKEKKSIFGNIELENSARLAEIDLEFLKMPYTEIRKVINEIEDISPIYCDFYQDKKVGDKQEIQIDHNKLEEFSNKLDKCIEVIKSGRAENIKEALNVIKKDMVDEEKASLERARNAQIFELNKKLEEYDDDGYYDY